ncbi:MAG: response regulator transcription factor [Dysgonomonas sp.]|nr:response regulator transcription factor [Dysgonomonas sp.]
MEATILLVEDDHNLAFMLSENLEVEGFNVITLTKGEDVLNTVKENEINAILMDVDLDGEMDGFETAENLRMYYPELPIIFTTGKTHFKDTERGFRLGYVDYQKKPYGARELIARITNLLRRKPKDETNRYASKGFSFDSNNHVIVIDNKETKLTKTEAAFLSLLCNSMNDVVSKETIATHLWGQSDIYMKDHSLNNLSHRIRKYIEGNPYVELKTISKVGYRLVEKK